MYFNIIVAYNKNNKGIGLDNELPWHIPEDLNYFKNTTSKSNKNTLPVVIMGRNTWESIPNKFKPLRNRINIILSKTLYLKNNNVYTVNSIDNCIDLLYKLDNIDYEQLFVIGGESIYKQFINTQLIKFIHLTEIYSIFNCDSFFPNLPDYFKIHTLSCFMKHSNIHYRRIILTNTKDFKETLWKNVEEYQYLNIMQKIIKNGEIKNDRTNVGIYSIFGEKLEYDLKDTFPLVTTKKQFVRGIFEELKFYLSGSTNNKDLNKKKIHIWDGNTTREFLDNRELFNYPDGDLGETYGFNFRHYGADYITCNEDYSNQGYDQVSNVINLIKNNPTSRRIIINLWNSKTIHKAALPPCLCQYQFNVNLTLNTLNLMIYIRSSDFFLANNWNTCTGAFLVHMICNLNDINLKPGKLIVITGDTHIYKTHIEAVKINLEREPKPYPKLIIKNKKDKLEDFQYDDIELIDYLPFPNIKVEMAV